LSTTLGALKTEISAAVRDPDAKTFDDSTLTRLANSALAEVGKYLPEMFQEDITPLADTLEYPLRSDDFAAPVAEIEVARVELWDGSTTPATRLAVVPAASAGYVADSEVGWSNWGGTLSIPRRVWSVVDGHEADYLYRVWGYSPYVALAADNDSCNLSTDGYWAVVAYAKVEALDRLVGDRVLFTQWQTRSGNTDISPAGLMNDLTYARADWRQRSRGLLRLRAQV
jgi:hypothetical protein